MRLTPLDIKKQDFGRTIRGYDPDEVQAFLAMVADEWEEMRAEHRRMDSKVQEFENKLEHYEKVEEALQEALQTARENSKSKLEHAERQAALTIQEAKAQAREIVQDAEQRRHQLAADIERLNERRDEVVARLRAFLTSELEMLSRFRARHPLDEDTPGAASVSSLRTSDTEDEADFLSTDDLKEDRGDEDAEGDVIPFEAVASEREDEEAEDSILETEEGPRAETPAYAAGLPFASFAVEEAAGDNQDDAGDNDGTETQEHSVRIRYVGDEPDTSSEINEEVFDFFDLEDAETDELIHREEEFDSVDLDEPATEVREIQPEAFEDEPLRHHPDRDEAPRDESLHPEHNEEIERIRRILDELE